MAHMEIFLPNNVFFLVFVCCLIALIECQFYAILICVSQRGGGSGPLIYLIVLDTCMDDEDFQAVKVWLHTCIFSLL